MRTVAVEKVGLEGTGKNLLGGWDDSASWLEGQLQKIFTFATIHWNAYLKAMHFLLCKWDLHYQKKEGKIKVEL